MLYRSTCTKKKKNNFFAYTSSCNPQNVKMIQIIISGFSAKWINLNQFTNGINGHGLYPSTLLK